MKIYFEVGVYGAYKARERGDICIVIDVLRASSTIIAAFMRGFPSIKLYHCITTIKKNSIIVGEYKGQKPQDCHFGNSPVELLNSRDINGELLFFSSNGSPCIAACLHKQTVVFIGAIINSKAVGNAAKAMAKHLTKNISIIFAGCQGVLESDDLLAGSIIYSKTLYPLSVIGDIQPVQPTDILQALLTSQPGLRLISIGHEQDIRFCAQEDITDIVPVYNNITNQIEIFTQLSLE